jgi:uncharacterized heparinase superfamily protein
MSAGGCATTRSTSTSPDSAHFDHGHARKAGAIVLKSQVRPEKGAKIRWKLTRAEG